MPIRLLHTWKFVSQLRSRLSHDKGVHIQRPQWIWIVYTQRIQPWHIHAPRERKMGPGSSTVCNIRIGMIRTTWGKTLRPVNCWKSSPRICHSSSAVRSWRTIWTTDRNRCCVNQLFWTMPYSGWRLKSNPLDIGSIRGIKSRLCQYGHAKLPILAYVGPVRATGEDQFFSSPLLQYKGSQQTRNDL